MNKKVLIMCTGNSCRSIMGEALINCYLDGVEAYSCGVAPLGRVNPDTKKVLRSYGCWEDGYYSKHLDAISNIEFDLIVTVCDHAKETCPIFSKPAKKVHIGFEDPDGGLYGAFEETYREIKSILLPEVRKILGEKI